MATQVHVVSFAPAHESLASVGGFEWRFDFQEAFEEYNDQVGDSTEFGGSHVVRLVTMTVPDGLHSDLITQDLDRRLDELEDTAQAIKQFVPEHTQHPPTGGCEEDQEV